MPAILANLPPSTRRLLIAACLAAVAAAGWDHRTELLAAVRGAAAPAVEPTPTIDAPAEVVAAFAPVRTAAAALPAAQRTRRAALYRALAAIVPQAEDLASLSQASAVNLYAGQLAELGPASDPAVVATNQALEAAFRETLGAADLFPTDQVRTRLQQALAAAAAAVEG